MNSSKDKLSQAPIALQVVNDSNKQPVIFPGQPATLDFSLTNNTGGNISLLAGASPSRFELLICPPFGVSELSQIKVITAGWKISVNKADQSVVLTCTKAGEWPDNTVLTVQLTGSSSLTPPQGSIIQVNLSGFGGSNIPLSAQTTVPLTLQNEVTKNPPLNMAIECFLSGGGIVYVSDDASNLVTNSLTLNIKNKGLQALYTGEGPWGSTPSALAYFVYGSTVGALAPINSKLPPDQTALNIKKGKVQLQDNDWDFEPFDPGTNSQPQWTLTPQKDKLGILGTDESATVSFTFDGIVSLTPVGQTQMYVQFSGFPGYDGCLFSLNIDKRELPNPGVCSFFSIQTNFTIHSENDLINIPLQWSITGVSGIQFSYSLPGLPPFTKSYQGVQTPLIQDSTVLSFSGIKVSSQLVITCNAFDENGNNLIPGQFNITVDFPPRVLSYSGTLLPNGEIELAWQTAGATQVAIAFLGLQAANSDGIQAASPPMPLLNNNQYALIASNNSDESSEPALLKQGLSYGSPTLIYGGENLIRDMTVSPDSSLLYAVDGASFIGIKINYPAFQPQISMPFAPTKGVSISMAPDGKFLFAGCVDPDDLIQLAMIFPPDNQLAYIDQLFGPISAVLAVNYPETFLVFSGFQGNQNGITVLEFTDDLTFTNNPVVTGSDIPDPIDLAISADGKFIFVGDSISYTIIPIERHASGSYSVLPPIPDTCGRLTASPTGPYLYNIDKNMANLIVIKISGDGTFTTLSSLPAAAPVDIAISADGNLLFTADSDGSNSISVIQVAPDQSLKVVQTIVLNSIPTKLAVSPDGNFVFAVTGLNNIYVLTATAGSAILS